jgi:hypothetical protein
MEGVDERRVFKLDRGKVGFQCGWELVEGQPHSPHLTVLSRMEREGAGLRKVT